MKYQFLLFDADYTLLDFPQDMLQAFRLTHAACFSGQVPYSDQLLACYNACNNRAWDRFERGECTKQELYIDRFVEFLTETGLTGDPQHINTTYFSAMAETGTAYPGAKELAAELCKEYSLYIITNGNVVSALPRLEHAGLAPYFKDVFVSEAVGVGKPHKRYFDYVASHIEGFAPERALVIGDSPTSDLQGAANAGLDSLWYDPHGSDKAASFTYRAKDYDEIERIFSYV